MLHLAQFVVGSLTVEGRKARGGRRSGRRQPETLARALEDVNLLEILRRVRNKLDVALQGVRVGE